MDTQQWGRVDESGGVWVRTADGERQVGSYPGVPAEEALAYFGRKYDELRGQVTLLEQRIRGAGLGPKDALASIARLEEASATANAVGDLDGLRARLDALVGVVEERRAAGEADRARAREEARAVKERIVTEAEELSTSSQWKPTGDRLRALLEEWKSAPRLERGADDALWKRFSAARTAFDKRRRQHFSSLDAQRDESRARKEELVAEAESLSASTDWATTSARYRELMSEWRSAGRAGKDADDALWQRFRGAQDRFFAARGDVLAERDAGQRANLAAKEALLAEAQALLPVRDSKEARRALRSIHERWDAVGHVPRDAKERIEAALRRVDESVRGAEDTQWRRTNPEARARAESTVAQLRTSIAALDARAAAARAAGREREVAAAEDAASARRTWLAEAERTLAELSR